MNSISNEYINAEGIGLRDRTILITGGSGFIASHLVEKLMDNNKIIIYDNFSRDSLKFINKNENVRIVKGDILDSCKLAESMKNVNIIIHLAAVAGVQTITKSPITTMKTNLIGTYNVLEAAVKNGKCLERLLLSSTSEVYGPLVYLAREDEPTTQGPPNDLRWIYSTSKIASEHLAYSYHVELGLPITILRFFNIYGPRQTGGSAMHNFICAANRNEPLIIYGNGLQVRAWCYVSDAVAGILLSLVRKKAIGKVINIGNPTEAITTSALAIKIIRILESKSGMVRSELGLTDVKLRMPSIELAEKLLGYQPRVSLDCGIRETAKWYRLVQ
jgi:nucleoside-diphosphate-sugar epimerase